VTLPTNEEIIEAYKGLANEQDKDAARVNLALQLQKSGKLCTIFILCVEKPITIPSLMADSILLGIALAEARQLEELHKL
jgi:hypothetical protein